MQSLQNNGRVNNYLKTTLHAPIPPQIGIPPETATSASADSGAAVAPPTGELFDDVLYERHQRLEVCAPQLAGVHGDRHFSRG